MCFKWGSKPENPWLDDKHLIIFDIANMHLYMDFQGLNIMVGDLFNREYQGYGSTLGQAVVIALPIVPIVPCLNLGGFGMHMFW